MGDGYGTNDDHVRFVAVQLKVDVGHPGLRFEEAVGEGGWGNWFGGDVNVDNEHEGAEYPTLGDNLRQGSSGGIAVNMDELLMVCEI